MITKNIFINAVSLDFVGTDFLKNHGYNENMVKRI